MGTIADYPASREQALKKIHTVVAVLGVALAGGGAWWWQNKAASATAPSMAGGGAPAAQSAGGGAGGGAAPAQPGPPQGGPGDPAAVEVARAESLTLNDDVQAVGSLTARQSVVLRPEVSGRIASMGFNEGQRVRRGQLIVQLDDTLQRAQMQQAEAQATIARTNFQRSRELLAQNFVSQSAVDQNGAAVAVAEAQVALARAQLARMRVLAPFDGTAGLRQVDVGDYLKDGADIVTLEDLSSLAMEFRLPEQFVSRLRTGQAVEVALDAMPQRVFKARVEALDSQVSAEGRALLVKARLEDGGTQLRPGMFARGRVVFAVRENAVVVPEEALVPVGARQFVFKITDGADGTKVAQRVEARIGVRLPGKVELLAGISAGDTVVTAGQSRLMRGDAVPVRVIDLERVTPPRAAAAPGAAGPNGPNGPNGPASPPKH